MYKRFLAMVLAAAAVLTLSVPAFAAPGQADAADVPAAAATTELPTEEEVHERLMALREVYPDGMHWDSSSYYTDRNGLDEYGCFGFAIMLQEAVFPASFLMTCKYPPVTMQNVHVGDILSYGISAGSGGHSVIVTEVCDDYVVVAEGNVSNGVSWGRTMSAAEVSAVQYRWTYYTGQRPVKNGWIEEDGAWYYYEYNWKVTSAWRQSGGARYYLGSDGKMAVGWGQVAGKWYYFNDQHDGTYGRALVNEWLNDGGTWYYFGADGAMAVGWCHLDGRWYYFNSKHDGTYGRMLANEWLQDGGPWYYMGPDGAMAEGLYWVIEGGYEGLYCFNGSHDGTYGKMLSGWQTVDGDVYYLETRHNGRFGQAYVDGTYVIDGTEYTFDAFGRLIQPPADT